MKLGFLTAALPGLSLEEAAKWGAESGFEAIEIACWPYEKAARRYAGVTHIDVENLDQAKAKQNSLHVGRLWSDRIFPGVLPQPLTPRS